MGNGIIYYIVQSAEIIGLTIVKIVDGNLIRRKNYPG